MFTVLDSPARATRQSAGPSCFDSSAHACRTLSVYAQAKTSRKETRLSEAVFPSPRSSYTPQVNRRQLLSAAAWSAGSLSISAIVRDRVPGSEAVDAAAPYDEFAFPMSAVLRGYQHNTQLESTHTLLRLRLFYSGSAQSNATASERRGVGGATTGRTTTEFQPEVQVAHISSRGSSRLFTEFSLSFTEWK
eukprot:1183868-Prorocentrum_minimum.AAC.4